MAAPRWDELERAIRAKDSDAAERLWLELLESDSGNVEGFLKASDGITEKAGGRRQAGVLLWMVAGALKDKGRDRDLVRLYVRLARIAPDDGTLRQSIVDAVRRGYAARGDLEALLDKSGVVGGTASELAKQAEALERYLRLEPGAYVFHKTGWGIGRIVEYMPDKSRCVIDFVSKAGHQMDLLAAADLLERLPDDDLRVMAAYRRDELRKDDDGAPARDAQEGDRPSGRRRAAPAREGHAGPRRRRQDRLGGLVEGGEEARHHRPRLDRGARQRPAPLVHRGRQRRLREPRRAPALLRAERDPAPRDPARARARPRAPTPGPAPSSPSSRRSSSGSPTPPTSPAASRGACSSRSSRTWTRSAPSRRASRGCPTRVPCCARWRRTPCARSRRRRASRAGPRTARRSCSTWPSPRTRPSPTCTPRARSRRRTSRRSTACSTRSSPTRWRGPCSTSGRRAASCAAGGRAARSSPTSSSSRRCACSTPPPTVAKRESDARKQKAVDALADVPRRPQLPAGPGGVRRDRRRRAPASSSA